MFFGRHENSVDFDIWTPEFGGGATIDLALVEFDIEFGSEPGQDDPPPLDRFLSRQLSLPATPNDTNGAMVARFSTADVAGLLRVDLTAGRAAAKPQDDSGAQEGIAAPIAVNAEFVFAVRTKLPIEATAHDDGGVTGLVDLPLCERSDLASRIDLGIAARDAAGAAVSAGKPKKVWWIDSFPVATFGATPVTEVQADELPALKAIALGAGGCDAPAHRPGHGRLQRRHLPKRGFCGRRRTRVRAARQRRGPPAAAADARRHAGDRLRRQVDALPRRGRGCRRGGAARQGRTAARPDARRDQRLQAPAGQGLHGLGRPSARTAVTTRVRKLSVAETSRGTVIDVPASRIQAAELAAVALRVMPAKAPSPIAASRLERQAPAPHWTSGRLARLRGPIGSFSSSARIPAGGAVEAGASTPTGSDRCGLRCDGRRRSSA